MRISVQGSGDGVRVRMRLDRNRWRRLITSVALWILVVQGVIVGVWATVTPEPFYRSFPFGLHWISMDGPYNHHLIADLGAFFLGLSVVAAVALYTGDSLPTRAAGLGWLVFGVPHLIYHATHQPDGMSTGNYVLSMVAVALLPLLGLAALLAAPRERIRLRDPAPMNLRFPRRRNG